MNIKNHLIDFEAMPWQEPAKGVRSKTVVKGKQQLRLVEFSYGFAENDWCVKGHAGIVLVGAFANNYAGQVEHYTAGDIFLIPQGESDKHKVVMSEGQTVLLLLFEILEA